jgi:outer membrane protein with beta-barrel domain
MFQPCRLVVGAGAALLVGAFLAPPVEAQRQFEITPFLGYLIPAGTLYQGGNLGAKISQTSGLTFGGNFAYNMSSRLAFEGGLTFGSGKLDLDPGALPEDHDNIFVFSAVARYRVNPLTDRNKIHVLGGLGIIHHGGDAVGLLKDAGTKGFTDLGLVIGGSYMLTIGHALNLRFEGRDHIYSSKLTDNQGGESGSSLQNDFVLMAGISLPLGEPIQRR